MRFYDRTEELAILTLSSSYTKFFDFVYKQYTFPNYFVQK